MDSTLTSRIERLLEGADFSGVVQVADAGAIVFERVRGLANRERLVPITRDTPFALASGTKAFTALTVMSLVADRSLSLETPMRTLLARCGISRERSERQNAVQSGLTESPELLGGMHGNLHPDVLSEDQSRVLVLWVDHLKFVVGRTRLFEVVGRMILKAVDTVYLEVRDNTVFAFA